MDKYLSKFHLSFFNLKFFHFSKQDPKNRAANAFCQINLKVLRKSVTIYRLKKPICRICRIVFPNFLGLMSNRFFYGFKTMHDLHLNQYFKNPKKGVSTSFQVSLDIFYFLQAIPSWSVKNGLILKFAIYEKCVSTTKNVQKPKVTVLEVKKVMVTKNGPYFSEMRALCSQVVFRDFFSN